MAIFGEGMSGVDPLAKARANAQARDRKRTTDNITRLGEGSGAFDKGVIAAGEIGGEHLAAGLMKLFGVERNVDPEVAAAQQQAALVGQINEIEGDPSSAEYARQAGVLAQEAGRQDIAYGFAQEAGSRQEAETARTAKNEAARLDAERKSFSAQPESVKLALIAEGNERALAALGLVADSDEGRAIMASANTSLKTKQIKDQKQIDDLKAAQDPSVKASDQNASRMWRQGNNIFTSDSGNAEAQEKFASTVDYAHAAAAKAKLKAELAKGNTGYSQADAFADTWPEVQEQFTYSVHPGEGNWFTTDSDREKKGQVTIDGFKNYTAPEPYKAPEPPAKPQGQATRSINLTGK